MFAQSGGEVNRLLDRRLVECLLATDAAHGDLPRGHQGPEQHGRRFRVGIRMKRSATPFPSGSRTKEGELSTPKKAIS